MLKLIGACALALLVVPTHAGEPAHWAYPLVVEKNVAPGSEETGPIQIPGATRAGTRSGPSAAMMQPVVAQLNEDDMLAIAAYLATLKP